ncbi:MAG: glycosyltransferase [Alistipes indistinctus]
MVTEIRQGLSHARNCGINHAKGDYFAIIDDDELVNRDFLKSYYDFSGCIRPQRPAAAWSHRCTNSRYRHGSAVMPNGRSPEHSITGKRSFPFRNTPIPAAGIWVSGARPSNVTGCSIRNWGGQATLRWAAREGPVRSAAGRRGRDLLCAGCNHLSHHPGTKADARIFRPAHPHDR